MESPKNQLIQLIENNGAILAFIVALIATLGSLYFSEILHFIPCTLCWYQRILMYPLVFITLVGIIEQDEFLPKYVLPFSIIGLGVATYHYLIQLGILPHSAACSVGVPCGGRYIDVAGFITIPLLALVAFLLITIIMVVLYRANSDDTAE
ncbi:MAG: disulfide bond formation protein B [Chloroflexi bacterium]|nr:disulfide bond formation protein B [Chloroflexota bacterium]